MANSYKDIIITPNRSNTADPKIEFRGANTTVNTSITVQTYPISNGMLSFEGSAGQLFSITNDLSGSIFSVNDISGIPSIEVFANGQINFAQYGGNITVGGNTAFGAADHLILSSTSGISANGTFGTAGQALVTNGSAVYWSNNPGYTGSKGDQGVIGYTGSQGDTGYTGSAGPAGGSNTQIQFNDSGVANGAAGFTFNKSTNTASLSGILQTGNTTITGFANVSSTLQVGGVTTFNANVNASNNTVIAPSFKAYTEAKTTNATATGSVTLDLSTSNIFELTLTGNTTITFSNPPASTVAYTALVYCKQDAVGGRTITWPATVKWPNASTPTATTTANKIDVFNFFTLDGGTTYVGALSLANL